MWFFSTLAVADTGDIEYCETSRPGGVLRGQTCVFENVDDFCAGGCALVDVYLEQPTREREVWKCAPGSEFGYVLHTDQSDADSGVTVWFGPDGNRVAQRGSSRVCCENVLVHSVEVAYPGHDALGTCYAPVYAQLEHLLDPTSQTCEPTPEGKGCATAPSAPLWSGLLALLLLRVRR